MQLGPSDHELELVRQVRERLNDLKLDEDYLEAKNLVRFVRARNGDLDRVETMIRSNVQWLKDEDVANVFDFEAPSGFDESFPFSIVSVDKSGSPLVVLPIGSWDPYKVSGFRLEFIRWALQGFQKLNRLQMTESKSRDYIPQFNIIVDLQGLGWRHYTSYDALQGVMTMVRYFEANYPDTLRLGVFVNCPSILSLFWKMMKPIISEATQEKLNFLGYNKTEWINVMSDVINEHLIPIRYGGLLNDNCKLYLDSEKGFIGENGNELIEEAEVAYED